VSDVILDNNYKFPVNAGIIESENRYAQSVDTFYFSLASVPTEDGIITAPIGLATCRESLITMVENEVLKKPDGKGLPLDKGRFVVRLHRDRIKNTEKAFKVLHLYENAFGFPRTLCYHVEAVKAPDAVAVADDKMKPFRERVEYFYILTSRKWIKSSYMVSLLFLILRNAYQSGADISEKALESLDTFKEMLKTPAGYKFMKSLHMSETYRYWETILRNYHELFGKFAIEHNWNHVFNEMRDDGTMRYEGVYRLCSGNTQSAKIRKRWDKIKKSESERKPA
jgi:hypothetical protein